MCKLHCTTDQFFSAAINLFDSHNKVWLWFNRFVIGLPRLRQVTVLVVVDYWYLIGIWCISALFLHIFWLHHLHGSTACSSHISISSTPFQMVWTHLPLDRLPSIYSWMDKVGSRLHHCRKRILIIISSGRSSTSCLSNWKYVCHLYMDGKGK